MVEKPILIQNNKDKISTTREQLLNEEKNKIISNKSCVSHFNRIDKDKYSFYKNDNDEHQNHLNSFYQNKKNSFLSKSESNNIISLKHNLKQKESNQNFLQNKNIYTQSSDNLSINKKIINNYNYKNYTFNNTNYNNNAFKLIQPSMRFKPRSDLERVYLSMSENDTNFANKTSKNVINLQLNKMDLNTIVRDEYSNNIYEPNFIQNYKEVLRNNKIKNKNNIKENFLNKKQNFIKKINKPDNSKAKILHIDLYNKTYFNAVENYSLFKNSCFLPHKFNTQVNKSLKNLDKKNNSKKPNLYLSNNFSESKIHFKRKKINDFISNNNNKIYSTNDLINTLKKHKKNNSNEEQLIDSLNNIDIFTNGFKEKKRALSKQEQIDLNIIKSLAFEKNNNNPILINKDNSLDKKINENENIETKFVIEKENNNLTDFNFISSDNDEYFHKKSDEKIIIDGVEYKKNDMGNLSKVIMLKCNFSRKKKFSK